MCFPFGPVLTGVRLLLLLLLREFARDDQMARRVKMSVLCVYSTTDNSSTHIDLFLFAVHSWAKKNYLILDVAPPRRMVGERGRESVPVVGRRWSENLSHSSDITSAFLSYI
jgi:hypothetical protein